MQADVHHYPTTETPFSKHVDFTSAASQNFIPNLSGLFSATPCLGWKQLFIICDVFSGLVTFDAVFDKWVPDLWCKILLARLLTAERFTTRGTPFDSRTFVCGSPVEIWTFYVFWLASCLQNVASSLARLFFFTAECFTSPGSRKTDCPETVREVVEFYGMDVLSSLHWHLL